MRNLCEIVKELMQPIYLTQIPKNPIIDFGPNECKIFEKSKQKDLFKQIIFNSKYHLTHKPFLS